jgi:hypothetical protein
MTEEDQPKPKDVASSGPSILCNKFVVALGHVVRMTFLEQAGPTDPEYFRASVTMSYQDAIALKNLLSGMLADAEKQISTLQAKNQAASDG